MAASALGLWAELVFVSSSGFRVSGFRGLGVEGFRGLGFRGLGFRV